jgi:cytochrome c-type biogenesis protein CcmH
LRCAFSVFALSVIAFGKRAPNFVRFQAHKRTTLKRKTHSATVNVHESTRQRMTVSRREFMLGAPAIAWTALAVTRTAGAQSATQTFNGPMAAAEEVYRPVKLPSKPGVSPAMNTLERDDLEHHIKCQCGCNLDVFTCRTTDFSCTVSPAMHGDVLTLVEGGYDGEEIMAAFQSVYGERVLMAPVKSGFNLLGYAMPFLVLGGGAIVVAAVLRRMKSRRPEPAVFVAPELSATREELARLDAAIKKDS